MIIVWGTKIKRTQLGVVGDFCPICRDFQQCSLTRITSHGHIYFLSFGSGTVRGYERTCENCGQVLLADLNHYAMVADRSESNVAELVRTTNPRGAERHARRLAVEQRVRQRQLSAEERMEAIREPFLLVNPTYEARRRNVNFDLHSALGFWATILVPAAILIGASVVSGHIAKPVLYTAMGLGGAAFLFTLCSVVSDCRRFSTRVLYPRLIRSLHPLQPTLEELWEVQNGLKSLGVATRKLNISDLHEQLLFREQFGIREAA